MKWTAKAILGLMLLLVVWGGGFFGLDLLIRTQSRHDDHRLADWQLFTIGLIYCLAGPVSGVLWVRWVRRKAGDECVEETSDRIGALRVAVRPLEPPKPHPPEPAGRIEGVVSLSGLPPHRGLILYLSFYKVSGCETPPPYNGDPPASAAVDVLEVAKDIHMDVESTLERVEHPFAVKHARGYFYVAVRVILFRRREEQTPGQVEQFFFGRRPLRITELAESPVTFPVVWPPEDLEKLHFYGTVQPER